jgi:hypothetical protein
MNVKPLLLLVLACSAARASDCIPLTFKTLSEHKGTPVAYDVWAKDLSPTGESPTLEAAIHSWNSRFPDRKLICVYSIVRSAKVEDRPIVPNSGYLWIGKIPPEMAADPKSTEAHSAVLYIANGQYKLYHTLDPKGKKFLVEHLDEEEFFSRTFAVYLVEEKR